MTVADQKVSRGSKIKKPNEPIRKGYTFEGWYASKDFNQEDKWSFIGYTVTEDMTLYAKWIPSPTAGLFYNCIGDAYEVSFEYHSDLVGETRQNFIVIQSHFNGLPVTRIAENGFMHIDSITHYILPDTITTIGKNAFAQNSYLKTIVLPNSIVSIEDSAFVGCVNLEVADLPYSLKSLGNNVFEGCSSLKYVTLPSSVESIGDNCFEHCTNLRSITIPLSVKNIGKNAFLACNLTIYAESSASLDGWSETWNTADCPVFWNCFLSTDRTYVAAFFAGAEQYFYNPKNIKTKEPYRKGYTFMGWFNMIDQLKFTAESIANATEDDYGRLVAKWEKE